MFDFFFFPDYGSCWRSLYTKEDAWLFLYGRCALNGIIRTIQSKRNNLRWVGTILHNDEVIRSGNHLLQGAVPFHFPFPFLLHFLVQRWLSGCLTLWVNQLSLFSFYYIPSASNCFEVTATTMTKLCTATMRKEEYLFVYILINLPRPVTVTPIV